jgi:predicted ester cyclase
MSETDRNIAVIRAHHEKWAAGAYDAAVLDFAEDTRNHGRPVGRKGVAMVLGDITATFPDVRIDIKDIVAVDDQVIVRCLFAGTHLGVGRLPVNGGLLVGVEPTGKSFSVQHIHWYTLKDGKIIEHRANRDDVSMMQQLGLLPPTAPMDPSYMRAQA